MSLRALDTNEPLERYLYLKAEIDRLSDELDELKPEITAALWEEPQHRTVFMGFEIELGKRSSYRYSEAVQEMESDLKALKDYERATGTASVAKVVSFPVVKSRQAATSS